MASSWHTVLSTSKHTASHRFHTPTASAWSSSDMAKEMRHRVLSLAAGTGRLVVVLAAGFLNEEVDDDAVTLSQQVFHRAMYSVHLSWFQFMRCKHACRSHACFMSHVRCMQCHAHIPVIDVGPCVRVFECE
jgi:hypothetical protein